MATSTEWMTMLRQNGWVDESGKIVAPGEAVIRVMLPDGRSFTVRGGKSSPPIHLSGEFLMVQENNIDTSGRSRLTAVPLSAVLSIDALA